MGSIWPYISFVLGAIFAILLQWISYRLSFRREQRREYWIRKLNSYQDFYQHTTQLIELISANISIPSDVYWGHISLARKAAYDAAFYDRSHLGRANRMKAITVELIQILQSDDTEPQRLEILLKQIEEVQKNFYQEEKLLVNEANS